MAKGVRLVTPVFRACYAQVFEPKGFEGSEPKYSVVAVFDPNSMSTSDQKRWKEMHDALEKLSLEAFKKGVDKLPKNVKIPFRDSEEKDGAEGFPEGTVFCTLSSRYKPGIVDTSQTILEDPEEFYSGCYARATIIPFSFDNIAKGFAFGLQNLLKVKDGDRIDGRVSAEADFADFGDEELPE